jgi:predicted transposase/invertase (TIGR01784 family)
VLPLGLSNAVDWATLRRRPGSFVNEELSEQHTDLLFAARLGQKEAYLYLLFEHQSTADPWMLLRLLEYMARIWREHLARHEEAPKLPVIVPVVLHHSETGWTCATSFEELMDLDGEARSAALPYVPRFQLVLDDVSHATGDELRARAVTALGKLVLACFRHARDMRTLLRNLSAWVATMAEVRRTPYGLRAFALVLRYMYHAARDLDPGEIRALVKGATTPEIEEEMLSLADKLMEQGRQEGLQKGLQKGLQEGLQKGLQEGLQEGLQKGRAETVLKLLKLKFRKVPQSVAARVRAGSEAELDRWIERVLTARSLAEVLGD